MGPRALAIVCIVAGLLIYLGAVAGVFFADPTPPGDVGALSTLFSFLLFGGLAFLLSRAPPGPADPARPVT